MKYRDFFPEGYSDGAVFNQTKKDFGQEAPEEMPATDPQDLAVRSARISDILERNIPTSPDKWAKAKAVKDINNRKEMALDRLKDFKKQNIKINITDFLQKSGLLSETWTKKYKKSIDCSNPKGFSQRAHCAGRRKRKHGGKTKSKPV